MAARQDPAFQPPRSGQPAPVLVAWLTELVEEARQGVVPRFAELRRRLHSGEFRWDCAPFADAVLVWTDAANRLDLKSVRQKGLWANLTGHSERQLRHFNDGVAAVARGAALVREELPVFEAGCRSLHASRKMLVELDLERQSLAQELEPATGWLAEVAQLMAKTTAAHGANPTWAAAATRAETLPRDIRRLHLLADMAGAVGTMGLKIVARRMEALQVARALLEDFERSWMPRVTMLARTGSNAAMSPVLAAGAHDELLQRLETLTVLLHELEGESSEADGRLWELAELAT